MGFSFKSLWIKEDPKQATSKAVETPASNENVSQQPSATVNSNPVAANVVTPLGSPSTPTAGVVDPKYIEILGDKLDSLDMDGEDYQELKDAVTNLLKIPGMNEQTAFLSAFGTLEPRGLTRERCFESIEFYISELNKEKELFRQAQSSKYDEKVASIDNEIANLNEENEKANEEIQRLQEKIQNNNAVIAEKTQAMNENRSTLEAEQLNFDATLSHFTMVMESDRTKIEQYLGSTTNAPEQA